MTYNLDRCKYQLSGIKNRYYIRMYSIYAQEPNRE